ncbi:MAG: heavy metal-binding domain-containing protein [Nitrospirota bacterium]
MALAEKEAMLDIMNKAINMGANAIIDLKMTTSTYEQQGLEGMVSSVLYNKKMASKVIYNGTAVRI